jgi:hypothetical protein
MDWIFNLIKVAPDKALLTFVRLYIIQRELDDVVQITIARDLCKPMKFEDT